MARMLLRAWVLLTALIAFYFIFIGFETVMVLVLTAMLSLPLLVVGTGIAWVLGAFSRAQIVYMRPDRY